MAIINGTQIGADNVSGRDVGVLLKEKPFPYLYPDGVTRMSYDLAQLVLSDNVNMWSLKKPILLAGDNIDRSNNNWCAGTKGDYGIHIGGRNNLDTGGGRDLNVKKWVRDKPSVDSVYPARLADFGGYNHDAKPPIYLQQPAGSVINVNPYDYKFEIPFSTGDIPLSYLNLSSSTGWDKNRLRLMVVCTNTGLRYHCKTLLKDMTSTNNYEFENEYSALNPGTNYNFRTFIAQYADDSIYSATGDGSTIFNDNIYTHTDQKIRCKSMGEADSENITTSYSRYIETRNLFYKTNTVEWKSLGLSLGVDDPSNTVPFLDINNFDIYNGSLIIKLKFNCPDNIFKASFFRGFRSVTPMLDYNGNIVYKTLNFEGRLYRDFNRLNGTLSNQLVESDGYIKRGTTLYMIVPSNVYTTDIPPANVKPVRTTIGVFTGKETICMATFYVKSDSQAQTLPTPSWNN